MTLLSEGLFSRQLFVTSCCLVLLTVADVYGQSSLRDDSQEWNDLQVSIPLSKQIDFGVLGTLRFGRDINRPVDERLGTGFTFRAGEYLTFSSFYLYIATQPLKGIRIFENRISLGTTLKFPLGNFRFSDRNLLERRFRRPVRDSTRYRNKLQIEHSVGPSKLKLSLFVAEEVSYDWSVNSWVRNRASVGLTKVFNKHVTGDLYYLRQNDSHSIPGDLHVLGTALRLRL